MVYSSTPNVSSSTNNPPWACVGYDSNPNVDNLQPLHEDGDFGKSRFCCCCWIDYCCNALGRLMNPKTHGSHIIVIHPLGFFPR